MVLKTDGNINHIFISEGFKKAEQDPVSILPDEIVLKIFSHLNLATLGTICLVNKEWKLLANEPILWKSAIYREIAFGNDKWAQCFGTDVVKDEDNIEELSSLPWKDFIVDCKIFKSTFPNKNAKDSLMLVRLPRTLNGELTLKSLGELAKKFFKNSNTGYSYIRHNILTELGNKSIDKSHWVMMTKDVLPGSTGKTFEEQQNRIAEFANYEVPNLLSATTCILSTYFQDKICLFSNPGLINTRCKEKVEDDQTYVGGFVQDGLSINSSTAVISKHQGVAAMRKF